MATQSVSTKEVPITTYETRKVYTIELTQAEYLLFIEGIGLTSDYSRRNAGMTPEQAEFFGKLFWDKVK